ncbi:uncharacterized protein METZ01_LOCUS356016, partial [marine metagenome]
MKVKIKRLHLLSTAIVLLVACGGNGAPVLETHAVVETKTKVTIEATDQGTHTDTAVPSSPTDEPMPTRSPATTVTPSPITDELKPTSTPFPTLIPVPGQVVPTTPATNIPVSTTLSTPIPTATFPSKESANSNVKLNMEYAREMYPPDLATDVLSGLIEWPVGFNECIRKSVSEAKL